MCRSQLIDQAVALTIHRRLDTAAAIMPADDNVTNPQNLDRKLQHRQAVHIRVCNEICDVSVHKYLAGFETDDHIGRHTAVRAANPQIFRVLLIGKIGKKRRIVRCYLSRPTLVIFEKIVDTFHAYILSVVTTK